MDIVTSILAAIGRAQSVEGAAIGASLVLAALVGVLLRRDAERAKQLVCLVESVTHAHAVSVEARRGVVEHLREHSREVSRLRESVDRASIVMAAAHKE